jgi:hypothetical protein
MTERTFRYLQVQKARQNIKAFKTLIASPVSGAFKMPLGARLAVVSATGAGAGVTACSLVGARTRTIKAPLLANNQIFIIDFVEADVTVTTSLPFNLYIDTGNGDFSKIANGV